MQAIYYNYYGDLSKALEYFLECANWQKAHTVFVTSVAHKLFLSGKICLLHIKLYDVVAVNSQYWSMLLFCFF